MNNNYLRETVQVLTDNSAPLFRSSSKFWLNLKQILIYNPANLCLAKDRSSQVRGPSQNRTLTPPLNEQEKKLTLTLPPILTLILTLNLTPKYTNPKKVWAQLGPPSKSSFLTVDCFVIIWLPRINMISRNLLKLKAYQKVSSEASVPITPVSSVKFLQQ